jgi:3-oxoacyl-[acyl-carrier protein] reductase
VAQIKAMGGDADAIAVQANVGNEDDVIAMIKTTTETFGRLDVIVNNAGITKDGLVMRMKAEQWQSVIDINLTGVFYCSKEAFKVMAKQRKGRIINMSSVVGQIGNPGQANYAAAKGGVLGLTMSNAKEFASRKVTVNAVCPGFIASDMTDELSPELLETVKKIIPLGRLGEVSEVAGLVRFLALDPACNYMTGHTFNVDGGIAIGA